MIGKLIPAMKHAMTNGRFVQEAEQGAHEMSDVGRGCGVTISRRSFPGCGDVTRPCDPGDALGKGYFVIHEFEGIHSRSFARNGSRRQLVALKTGNLQRDPNQERRVIKQVSPPEARRLLAQAVQPLQAGVFDPLWSVVQMPCVDVEGGPDPDHHLAMQRADIFVHEQLLLWSAETNPDDIWRNDGQAVLQVGLFLRVERTKWRRVGTGDTDAGKAALEAFAELFGDS